MNAVTYVEFLIDFFVLFSIFINLLLLVTASLKSKKNYSVALVLFTMISFSVLLGFHEFLQIIDTTYKIANENAPFGDSIINEMFSLMAAMLIFSLSITKKRLKNVKFN